MWAFFHSKLSQNAQAHSKKRISALIGFRKGWHFILFQHHAVYISRMRGVLIVPLAPGWLMVCGMELTFEGWISHIEIERKRASNKTKFEQSEVLFEPFCSNFVRGIVTPKKNIYKLKWRGVFEC